MTEHPRVSVIVTFASRRYRIWRRPGLQPGTVSEFWPGRGVVGSERRWLGSDWVKHPTWYAAINPTGEPWKATGQVEDLPSRRAAIRWLLAHATASEESGR
jgi:hypothetical protein